MYLIIIVSQQTLTLNTFSFENELYNTSVDENIQMSTSAPPEITCMTFWGTLVQWKEN